MAMDSNKMLEAGRGEGIIVVPTASEVGPYANQQELLAKLNSLQTPNERIILLLKSVFNPRKEPTHEAFYVRKMALVGAACGLVIGGVLKSPDIHMNYQRQHNASVFDGKYRANRHFWDTLITGVASRGLGYGFKTAILSGSAGLVAFGSISYRNQLHLPDWLIGFTTLGALSRLWIGSKGVVAGAMFGLVAGLAGYGVARGAEIATGYSVTQMRLLHHNEWRAAEDARLRKWQRIHQEDHMDYLTKVLGREE